MTSGESRAQTPPTQHHQQQHDEEVDDDWEEWDGKGPFWVHCVAGSAAGVTEHALVYPLDTVRTHIQVCASCVHRNVNASKTKAVLGHSSIASPLRGALRATPAHQPQLPTGMWQTMRFLMNEPAVLTAPPPPSMASSAGTAAANASTRGAAAFAAAAASGSESLAGVSRLWRGVESILLGCIPAHALYFSVYETLKSAAPRNPHNGEVTTWAASLTGAAATVSHDLVMTPLDTVKQRMQLGHYTSTYEALREIVKKETSVALYRSFPITLVTNIPYGMVFMPINEHAKVYFSQGVQDRPAYVTVLMASSFAGFVASAVTTPLDRIKTALQTQTLAPACLVNPKEVCKQGAAKVATQVVHTDWQQAARFIWKTEGFHGFWRGLVPRVLSHTPALAISWTTYEAAKQALMKQHFQ
eukprot:CAMPEP_0172439802 /NCGR_PEP_ID=MMETSP1065-20121228/669_1 /TAXON_ID=265537 /ORGANISM="Amphiprora paludosa, Strain CCMP125" /LENGTH=413 /DNA_ID=CAMNT_0013188537 /DNA_START=240 /DNA_END=1481 /DNA_ORIENTATION=-